MPREPLPSGDTAEGFALHRAWEKKLFDARWAVVSWPREYGGREASLFEWLIFEEEYYRAGAPQRVTQNGIFLLAPTLFEFGTEEQKERILPRMAAGERRLGAGLVGAERGERSREHHEPRRVRDDARRRLAADAGRRRGARAARSATACSASSAAIRRPSATAASPTSSSRSAPPASRCARSAASTATTGFAEVFLDDVFVPDATSSAR